MPKAIDLKDSILSLTVLNIYSDDIQQVKMEVNEKVEETPVLFQGVPIVIQPKVALDDPTFLALLVEFLYQLEMIPIGVRSEDEIIQQQAEYAGLALFPENSENEDLQPKPTPVNNDMSKLSALIINKNVRSGQQIQAKNRDLIILGSVNPGAEIIADGNIHVYGQLLGRAFAGSSGFKQAKIFASNLNPEMVCIAGVYQLADGISAEDKEGFVEVSLVYDSLIFQANFLEELS